MTPALFRRRKSLLLDWARALVILGLLGPLLGRAGFRQTLALSLILGIVLWFAGSALRALRPGDPRLPAAGEGVLATLVLRLLAGPFGAEIGWPGAVLLGAAAGFSALMAGAERREIPL